MKITSVKATPVNIPASFDVCGVQRSASLSLCIVEITTDEGHTGYGMTAITEEEVVACVVNDILAPSLIGEDPLCHDKLWNQMYWLVTPRGQSGYASHAIAAVDIALWDIKGKALGQPVWKLLGGARSTVPVYATVGFDFFDDEQLTGIVKLWQDKGFDKFKMVVGHQATRRKDRIQQTLVDTLKRDAKRVGIFREAAGPDAEIFVDANCNLDAYHALYIATRMQEHDIGFFEEPLMGNDVRALQHLRQQVSIPLAGGQNEGQSDKFRELLIHQSLDILQPNVAITGGYTQCLKIAGMAEAFGVNIDNGGAWPFHNMHLHAGVRNGGMIEYHIFAVECLKQIFTDLPTPKNGWLTLPETPGLGFGLDREALAELAKQPTARGNGK